MKIISLLLSLLVVGCSSSPKKGELREWMEPSGKLKVLATTAFVQDLVQKVGGDHIDTLTLIKGDLDPHSYQLVKGDDEKLGFANLIFYNGLGLEHSPSIYLALVHNPRAIALGGEIEKSRPDVILTFGHDVDPHIWTDVSLWKLSIPSIVQALSERDPVHAEDYRLRGQKAYRELDQLDHEVEDIVHQIPEEKRFLVTSHDAFNYFSRRYLATDEEKEDGSWQKRFQAPEGLSPDSQLSPHQIQNLIDHLQHYKVEVLFPETNLSPDSILKIVDAGNKKGLTVKMSTTPLYGDAMGPKGSDGDTYEKMMLHNAKMIRNGLTGTQ